MIITEELCLNYKNGKGIFDINFTVNEGQAMGYLGPNGAGKTTTIRTLLGFMKPKSGNVTINGMDTFKNSDIIMKTLGYLPGEIAFPKNMKGQEFLRYVCDIRNIKDKKLMNSLTERFELDLTADIKKYSKGMKQKLAIITAFMHDPKVLILDEPTSGLDPLMQNKFIDLLQEEKKRGKTILLSSHMFEEVERTCDDVIIIKEGKLVAKSAIQLLKSKQRKAFIVKTEQIEELKNLGFELGQKTSNGIEMFVKGEDIDNFIKKLSLIHVTKLETKPQNLEEIFLNFYGKDGVSNE